MLSMNPHTPHCFGNITVFLALALAIGCAEPRPRLHVDRTNYPATQAYDASAPSAMDASALSGWRRHSPDELPELPASGDDVCCNPAHYEQCLQFHRNSFHEQGVRTELAERLARYICGIHCPLRPLVNSNRDASCADLPDASLPW